MVVVFKEHVSDAGGGNRDTCKLQGVAGEIRRRRHPGNLHDAPRAIQQYRHDDASEAHLKLRIRVREKASRAEIEID